MKPLQRIALDFGNCHEQYACRRLFGKNVNVTNRIKIEKETREGFKKNKKQPMRETFRTERR